MLQTRAVLHLLSDVGKFHGYFRIVLFNAGVDPHQDDRLGRLALTDHGLLNRDRLVLDACLRRSIPVATVIGGGYDDLEALVPRHALVIRAAVEQGRLYGL